MISRVPQSPVPTSQRRFVIFRPATSKWNKIEHRLFSFISSNWRGEPLRGYETIVNLIGRDDDGEGVEGYLHLPTRSEKISDRP